jgi:glycosyltransferase involved in cell wall biosynthesis
MDRDRYSPAVVVWNYNETEAYVPQIRELTVPLYPLPGTLSSMQKLRTFRRLVEDLNPEVIHSYTFFTNFAAWWAARGSKALPIGSIRNNFTLDRSDAGRVLGVLSARWPRFQICNSRAALTEIDRSAGPSKPSQVHVVRNALEIEQFHLCPLPTNGPRLLAVGRLAQEKRWDRLLRITAAAASQGLKFAVLHAGEGPLLQQLKDHAIQLGVSNLVHFSGPQSDIPSLLADSNFLIHTADDEGCPNVVMEAMACGRAVLATDAGDVPDLVEDGKTGFVVRRGDDMTMVDRMATLINDPDLCRRMGEAGRSKAEREFGLKRLVTETMAAYRVAGWKDA